MGKLIVEGTGFVAIRSDMDRNLKFEDASKLDDCAIGSSLLVVDDFGFC